MKLLRRSEGPRLGSCSTSGHSSTGYAYSWCHTATARGEGWSGGRGRSASGWVDVKVVVERVVGVVVRERAEM